ncbi:class III extradiol dioxygenase subunit B-like domain-containing protein [Haloechinothrix salitolerans]
MAIVPYPPLLVPRVAPGDDRQIAELRYAVLGAARWLQQGASRWRAVAADADAPGGYAGLRGSFAGYGAAVDITLSADVPGEAESSESLPLPVLIAGWLREQAGADAVTVDVLDPATAQPDCARAGAALATSEDTALLVLADGSNRHGVKSPGGNDDRAPEFDASIADALRGADADGLARIDPVLCTKLGAAGRVALQVAGGVVGIESRGVVGTRGWDATLHYSAAPFGVGYHVATWEAR